MARFDKIDDLLGELYRNRKLFSALFDKRMFPIHEELVLPLVDHDTEKLERLAAFDLINRSQSHISLDSRLQEFFEEFLEVDETVHVLYIQEHLNNIKINQSYYLKESQTNKRDLYLIKIKKHLRSITQITLSNVKTLRNNTDETYKTETNFEIKREKLANIRSQRDALEGIIKAVERLLQDDLFFKTAVDNELVMIIHRLRMVLNDSIHNLIEIQQQIIEHLNHIEKRVLVVEKVLRLKILRDKHYLKERTNFYLLAQLNSDLPLKKLENFRTRLSLDSLLNDESMRLLIFKVRDKLKNQKLIAQNIAGDIPAEAFHSQETLEDIVNLHRLKSIFMGKNQDLFSFVMQHQFSKEITVENRLRLFCQLASLFESVFVFSDKTGKFEKWEYALIYPGTKSSAENSF